MDIEEIFKNLEEQHNQIKEIVTNDSSFDYITAKFGIDTTIQYYRNNVDTSRKQKYLDTTEVQDTLKAFHLDSEKFWHLCLFLKDLAEGYANGINATTPREEISQLINLLNEIVPERDEKFMLSLKVGKKYVKIDNRATLMFISYALSNNIQKCTLLDDADFCSQVKLHKAPIYIVALFNIFLKDFLKDKVADKTIYASKDKSLLISRMIFILGISDDESFFDEYKEDGSKLNYLKNYVKKYKSIEVPTYISHYFFEMGYLSTVFNPLSKQSEYFLLQQFCYTFAPDKNNNGALVLVLQSYRE